MNNQTHNRVVGNYMSFILDNLNYLIWLGIFLAGLLTGTLGGITLYAKAMVPEIKKSEDDSERQYIIVSNSLLETYRREIANFLIIQDPPRYHNLWQKLSKEVSLLTNEQKQVNRMTAISDKYPFFEKFDGMGGWEYTLYNPDSSTEELEELYIDSFLYQFLRHEINKRPYYSTNPFLKENSDETHASFVKETVKEVSDFLVFQQLELAYGICKIISESRGGLLQDEENSWFRMTVIEMRNPDTEYGFYFKDTETYGVVTTFSSDEGTYHVNLYKSDHTFSLDSMKPLRDYAYPMKRLFIQNPFKV